MSNGNGWPLRLTDSRNRNHSFFVVITIPHFDRAQGGFSSRQTGGPYWARFDEGAVADVARDSPLLSFVTLSFLHLFSQPERAIKYWERKRGTKTNEWKRRGE